MSEEHKVIIDIDHNGNEVVIGGVKSHVVDRRDKKVGSLFGFLEYTPKFDEYIIDTISIKNQGQLNTCSWNAACVQKEKDEGVPLSVRGFVMLGRKAGFISGNGFAALRDNQKILKTFGIPEDKFFNNDVTLPWEEYSKYLLTKEIEDNAATHKISSYASASTKDEIFRLLEAGRIIETAMDWYDEYNMRGGFSAPWIIERPGKTLVGGHAFDIIGYKKNYFGRTVFVCQGSAGPNWCDGGKFYIPVDAIGNLLYTSYVNLDIPVDLLSFINAYQFQFVKVDVDGPAVYQILGDTKYPFPDEATLLAYTDGNWRDLLIHIKDQKEVDACRAMKTGPVLRIQDSNNWKLIKSLAMPERWKEVLKDIAQDPNFVPPKIAKINV